MTTEDDTCRMLKRIPLTDMFRIWKQQYLDAKHVGELPESIPNFYEKYGWTLREFIMARNIHI